MKTSPLKLKRQTRMQILQKLKSVSNHLRDENSSKNEATYAHRASFTHPQIKTKYNDKWYFFSRFSFQSIQMFWYN